MGCLGTLGTETDFLLSFTGHMYTHPYSFSILAFQDFFSVVLSKEERENSQQINKMTLK